MATTSSKKEKKIPDSDQPYEGKKAVWEREWANTG